MHWKAAAKQYLESRNKFAAMDDAAFRAYADRWNDWASEQLTKARGEKQAKAQGFYDALTDESNVRWCKEHGVEKVTVDGAEHDDVWLREVLHYLYEEGEYAQVSASEA